MRERSPKARRPRRFIVALLAAGLAGLSTGAAGQDAPEGAAPLVLLTEITGAIGPPATRQVADVLAEGERRGAEAAVLRLDTPGGLSSSTRDINKAILAARIPVVVHVAPPGARAASAGTYIAYASHVAAMAPGTNIGAATPVQMGGGGLPGAPGPGESPPPPEDEGAGTSTGGGPTKRPGDPMSRKAVNDAVAQIRSLAELRGRNAEWAERAVREGVSLSAREALEAGVVELVVEDAPRLVEALDGRTVELADQTVTLKTAGARVETLEPSFVTQILRLLSNPNVALLLMTLGFYGLVFELSSPGLGPGIPGAISLLLGLYALNLLPLNYAGLALIGLGLALMAAEALTSSFGVLGVGGAVAFALGAAMLVDTDVPAYQISWGLILGVTLLSLLIVTFVVGAIVRTRRMGAHAGVGATGMVGAPGSVEDWQDGEGYVRAHGERWRASGPRGLKVGDPVEITEVRGLRLTVARPSAAPKSEETT
jgi:membrane-bound serine protease (ClpP class)